MQSKLFPLLLIPGFIVCALLVRAHDAQIEEVRPRFTAEEMQAAKESIALSLMGQIQLTAHSLIWMKTLEYLHNGVALRMPTKAEESRGFHAHEATDVATGLAHKCGVPVALNEKMDWRGPVGTLHRIITPHTQIHRHSDPTELIPWYQLTLKLNPNLERLYSLDAFFLADFAGEPRQALELLEGGVEANPWTFEIRAALGRHLSDYHQQLGIPPKEAYERAAKILEEAIDYGEKEKARLESTNGQFDEYQEQLLRESYLFLARSLTELGRYDDALAVCDRGFKATGHNLLRVQKRVTRKRMEEDATVREASPGE
jgi:hypothetical protein